MSGLAKDSFLWHLEELRQTLLACVVAWAIALLPALFAAPRFVGALIRWCMPESLQQLNYFAPLAVFVVYMRMGFILAAVMASPYITYRLWRFLVPALYDAERRMFGRWLVFCAALFIAGGAFCVAAILPLLMGFAASFSTDLLRPVLGLSEFLSLAGSLILAFGGMFQMPVAVYMAVRFGVVRLEALRHGRPYVLIAVLVVAAVLTPPDVISQMMLAAPTWLLFELGLLLAARAEPKAAKAAPDEPAWQSGDSATERTADVDERAASVDVGDGMYDFYESEAKRQPQESEGEDAQ